MSDLIFHHYQSSPFSEKVRLIFRLQEAGVEIGLRFASHADYALDPVEGDLVVSTEAEWAVRRTDPVAGEIVVHFPRIGFQCEKI